MDFLSTFTDDPTITVFNFVQNSYHNWNHGFHNWCHHFAGEVVALLRSKFDEVRWVLSKFRGVAPSLFCIFLYPPLPLGKSSSSVFCQYCCFVSPLNEQLSCLFKTTPSFFLKKAVSTSKHRNFGLLHLSILYFFIIGGPHPLLSRQVGFFANNSPLFVLF